MQIRIAKQEDINLILKYEKHIAEKELHSIITLGRVLIAEDGVNFIGWLR